MQTFVVDKKNICSRFDAYYYQPKYKMLEQRIKSKYSVSSFQDLTVGVTNGLDYRAFVDEGIPYIRVGDIGKGEVHFRKVKRVPKKLLNEKKSAVPKKGNLLLTRKGSYGNAAVYETTDVAIVSSEVFCVRLRERIIPEYMAIFINSELGRLQFERNAVGAIMGSISQNALSSVFVPVPPQDVQEKIVTIMKEAYEKKRKLEQEADSMMDERKGMLYKYVDFPKEIKQESQTFMVESIALEGRFDASYYHPRYLELVRKLLKNKNTVPLVEMIKKITNGYDFRSYSDRGIPYLRVANIKPGEIDMSDVKFIPENTHVGKTDAFPKQGALLLTRKGSYGIACVYEENKHALISSEVFNISLNKGVNAKYIEIVLNSDIGQLQFERNCVGGIMGSLSQSAVESVLVPIPEEKIQDEVVSEWYRVTERKKMLNAGGIEVMKKARAQVKEILLG